MPFQETTGSNGDGGGGGLSESDDELAAAMDLHSLIGPHTPRDSPPQTADQVIEEIDQIMHVRCYRVWLENRL